MTIKILLIFLLGAVFSPHLFADEQVNIVDKNDSIERYGALENKVNFSGAMHTAPNPVEKLPGNNTLIDTDVQKLDDISRQQNLSTEKSDAAMNAIESSSALEIFVMGNKLGVLKFESVQMKDQNYALNALLLKTQDDALKLNINGQIEILGKEQKKVEDFVLEKQNKFNLVGWLMESI